MAKESAAPFVPDKADLARLREAARECRGCDLWEPATQTVFGAGRERAGAVLVGEQPGDQEDRRGEPFVGPAGRVLDRALAEAGLAREDVYLTNAVKHFRFTRNEGGKRRLHQSPNTVEVAACRPWLAAELGVVSPSVVVALGAVAGRSLLGPSFRVTRERGVVQACPPFDALGARPERETGVRLVATVHPSAVLRAEGRAEAYAGLVADLRVVASLLG
ncbi:UdgX family uracil-DNA binding protein [Actinocorallia sp. A-T 12471]|uniref:UdgX family uracil-DNA binding protein n=1 Tax=Actinocorallia sp. A-T 12471 TaxID=3089813 RepID=UPI0029D06094|nr:UdgX family uracil-DNA binding protein [Actinocorallia sp. A-T 12471]MDX6744813.1 UdgX family uracil-DNA binding protein [Actinocorallia sp. A-T 12471]